eukprot:TRINITY_DN12303_c1_g5_i1.p1 TRINITY_DN12303_c1_g5~~TRINITY_DN12303_c1_g5_i1.p1  ORF type:complete len:948 (+),score=169.78 TRINITY_DN12303_c1_g5_i1:42-2885(+)
MFLSLLSCRKSRPSVFCLHTLKRKRFIYFLAAKSAVSQPRQKRRIQTQYVLEKNTAANNVSVKQQKKTGDVENGSEQDLHLLDIDEQELVKEVHLLLDLLPKEVSDGVQQVGDIRQLLEVVLDLGRPPLARFNQGDQEIRPDPVTSDDLEVAIAGVTNFGGDNRAGINTTLHRISAIRNRQQKIIGLTCRVGRAVRGSAKMIADFIIASKSVLLLGPPGVGKTTVIRDVARMLADPPVGKRVVIVDTSNEIGGDGDIPHAGIGRARRMQVPHPLEQHKIMIEAVENHMPQVIIIDEIGTMDETAAARTIAQRGVQLIGTAHGNKLENLIKNPSLQDLVGGIQSVTLGDDTAKKRGVQKSILERKGPPTFDVCVEIIERGLWVIHPSVGQSVDALLKGRVPVTQIRQRVDSNKGYEVVKGRRIKREQEQKVEIDEEEEYEDDQYEQEGQSHGVWSREQSDQSEYDEEVEDDGYGEEYYENEDGDEVAGETRQVQKTLKILPYKIKRSILEQATLGVNFKFIITDKRQDADAAIGVRDELRAATSFRREMRLYGIPVYGMKTSKLSNLVKALNIVWKQHSLQEQDNDSQEADDDQEEAEEAEEEEEEEEEEQEEQNGKDIQDEETQDQSKASLAEKQYSKQNGSRSEQSRGQISFAKQLEQVADRFKAQEDPTTEAATDSQLQQKQNIINQQDNEKQEQEQLVKQNEKQEEEMEEENVSISSAAETQKERDVEKSEKTNNELEQEQSNDEQTQQQQQQQDEKDKTQTDAASSATKDKSEQEQASKQLETHQASSQQEVFESDQSSLISDSFTGSDISPEDKQLSETIQIDDSWEQKDSANTSESNKVELDEQGRAQSGGGGSTQKVDIELDTLFEEMSSSELAALQEVQTVVKSTIFQTNAAISLVPYQQGIVEKQIKLVESMGFYWQRDIVDSDRDRLYISKAVIQKK